MLKLLPYTLDQLRLHIERGFNDGMTWAAFAKGDIHIDHKVPRAALRYQSTSDENFATLWALTNLQPLWAADNLKKGAALMAA